MKRVIATYTGCVQIGPDEYKMKSVSKILHYNETFDDLKRWIASIGVKDICINDVVLTEADDEE